MTLSASIAATSSGGDDSLGGFFAETGRRRSRAGEMEGIGGCVVDYRAHGQG